MSDHDYEVTEDAGYLSSEEYAAYCIDVRDACLSADGGLMIGELHRSLSEKARPRWTINALGSLMAIGELEESWKLPKRYHRPTRDVRHLTRIENKDSFQFVFVPPARDAKTYPTKAPDERRITA